MRAARGVVERRVLVLLKSCSSVGGSPRVGAAPTSCFFAREVGLLGTLTSSSTPDGVPGPPRNLEPRNLSPLPPSSWIVPAWFPSPHQSPGNLLAQPAGPNPTGNVVL